MSDDTLDLGPDARRRHIWEEHHATVSRWFAYADYAAFLTQYPSADLAALHDRIHRAEENGR